MIDFSPVSLKEVIDNAVEEYAAELDGRGFDKKEIEFRVLATPAWRDIHNVQITALSRIDIESPLQQYMSVRVHQKLKSMIDENGDPMFVAVPRKGRGGKHTWYRLREMKMSQCLIMQGQYREHRDLWDSRHVVMTKLMMAMQPLGQDATIGDVYDEVLSDAEKRLLHGARMRAEEEDGAAV